MTERHYVAIVFGELKKKCKHKEEEKDLMNNFKAVFNKWYITFQNIDLKFKKNLNNYN